MRELYLFFTLFYIGGVTQACAQNFSLGLDGIFQPGLRLKGTYIPSSKVNDSVSFGMEGLNCSLIIPAGGKAEASLRELNVKVKQNFLTVNAGMRWPHLSLTGNERRLYNFSAGITGVKAGLRQGIWFYTANIGIVEDDKLLHQVHPFFIGALARIKVKGLHRHNIYGLAVVYQRGRILPLPILGFNRKLADKWFMSLLLPVQAELTHRFSGQMAMDLQVNFTSLRSGIGGMTGQQPNLQYRQLQISGRFRYRFLRNFRLMAEAGMAAARQLELYQGNELSQRYQLKAAPYAVAGIHINFGKSLIGSQLFGNEL